MNNIGNLITDFTGRRSSGIYLVGASTAAAIAVSLYYLFSGTFIVFQNLFYFPIIMSCIYFTMRGFLYSVCLAILYLVLILLFTRDTETVIQAISMSVFFIIIAVVVSSLTAGRKKSEKSLKESEEKFRRLFEDSMDATYIAKSDGSVIDANEAFLELFSLKKDEIASLKAEDTYVSLADRDTLMRALEERGMIKEFEVKLRTMDGSVMDCLITATARRAPDGSTSWHQGIIRDITRTKRLENELFVMSVTDELTGLYNRRGFFTLAEQQFKVAQRKKARMTLFFADLDKMKWINDTLGHGEGDRALIETATVLKETFRKSDITARMGGDEFAVLALDVIDETASKVLLQRLQHSIDELNQTEDRSYALSLSVGAAHYDPGRPCSLDELMAGADTSMYKQKKAGRQSSSPVSHLASVKSQGRS